MSRLFSLLRRPRVILLVLVLLMAASALFAFWLTWPRAHATINDATFAEIREDMTRAEVEALLDGPPRWETTQRGWPNDNLKERWGRWIVPLYLRSLAFPGPDSPGQMRDFEIMRKKGADFHEDGHYLVSWHHDLATISVVFDDETERVKGAALWMPRPRTWRDYPPTAWFRK